MWIRDRHRILGPVLIGCGLLLVPWLLYLSFKLPNTARARNWSLMWTGVDVAEAVGLILTGVLQWRRSPRRALPAAFTSALLSIDAWVDVTTSAPGHAKVMSILMATGVEVPAAIACLVLATSTFPLAARQSSRDSEPPSASSGAAGRLATGAQLATAGRLGTAAQLDTAAQSDPAYLRLNSGTDPLPGRNRSGAPAPRAAQQP